MKLLNFASCSRTAGLYGFTEEQQKMVSILNWKEFELRVLKKGLVCCYILRGFEQEGNARGGEKRRQAGSCTYESCPCHNLTRDILNKCYLLRLGLTFLCQMWKCQRKLCNTMKTHAESLCPRLLDQYPKGEYLWIR